jgi:hypothetical protein
MAPYLKPTETQFSSGGTTIGATFTVSAGTLDILAIPGLDASEQNDPGEAYYHFLKNLNRRVRNLPVDFVPDRWGVSFQQTQLNNGNQNHIFIVSFERKPVSGSSTQPA